MYLDADEIVYTDLNFMWEYLEDRSIVYHGQRHTTGEWWGIHIEDVIKTYGIPWVGKLNSGTYLFRKDEAGIAVLDYASALYKNHEGLNIPLWRGTFYPDEIFFAIAFGKFNLPPVEDDRGKLGRSVLNTRKIHLDVIKGVARLVKREELLFPSIVHFPGRKPGSTRHNDYLDAVVCDYRLERMRLYLYFHSPSYFLPFALIQLQRCGIFCINFFLRCFRYLRKRIHHISPARSIGP